MSDRNARDLNVGAKPARLPYEWVLERERIARRRRIIGVAVAIAFLAAILTYIVADSYFTAVN